MKIKNMILIIFVLIMAIEFCSLTVCEAAPIVSGYSIWDTKTTDDVQKPWTIKFNMPLDIATINTDNIFITDVNNQPVSTVLNNIDGVTVGITPTDTYTVGSEYRLYITNKVSKQSVDGGRGASLANPVVMPFIVASQQVGSYIKTINSIYNSLATVITVTVSPEVYSVAINGSAMHYQGNNVFKLGVSGLVQGGAIVVNALDSKGKSLAKQNYTIH